MVYVATFTLRSLTKLVMDAQEPVSITSFEKELILNNSSSFHVPSLQVNVEVVF